VVEPAFFARLVYRSARVEEVKNRHRLERASCFDLRAAREWRRSWSDQGSDAVASGLFTGEGMGAAWKDPSLVRREFHGSAFSHHKTSAT